MIITKVYNKTVEVNTWTTDLEDNVFYILRGEDGKISYLKYKCPCGCGESVFVPVVEKDKKEPNDNTWIHLGGTAMSPSMRYSTCGSHYFLLGGGMVQ
jgi:hypothetical protein